MARVMFVDDDVDTLAIFKKCVELFGHQAVTACTPDEALLFADVQDLDVVFVDLHLCETSGLELVSALRNKIRTANTPIYVLSAGTEHELGKGIEQTGAKAFLQKPVLLQSLLHTITEAITPHNINLSMEQVQ